MDLHWGCIASASQPSALQTQLKKKNPWHSNRNTISQSMFPASPSTLHRLHRTVCPPALCWLLFQTVSILQDYCNQEAAGCTLGAVSDCQGLVLGGVTALTNEAGRMVEHLLGLAKLIKSTRRNRRLLKGLRLPHSWFSITDCWSRSTSELRSL